MSHTISGLPLRVILIFLRLSLVRQLAFLATVGIMLFHLLGGDERGDMHGARSLSHHNTGTVRMISFRPDGTMLVALGIDGSITAWELPEIQECSLLPAQADCIRDAGFSPDSERFATLTFTGIVAVHEVATSRSRLLYQPRTRASVALCFSFSRDGKSLAIGQEDGRIALWDVGSGRCSRELETDAGFVAALAYSPDDRSLAFSSGNRSAQPWDLTSGRRQILLHDQSTTVCTLAFSPDGRFLILGNRLSAIIQVWDVWAGKKSPASVSLSGNLAAAAVSPDGFTLAAADYNGLITFSDLQTFRIALKRLKHAGVSAVSFAPDGRTLATGGVRWNDPTLGVGRPDAIREHPVRRCAGRR